MNTGAVPCAPFRQLITPDPYSPPTTNAPFFNPGITTTHSALSHNSSGIPLSGALRSSFTIAPASVRRLTSSLDNAANADVASRDIAHTITTLFMSHLQWRLSLQEHRRPQ